MDTDGPGLFDLPGDGPPRPSERRPNGRAHETWVRVVAAEVTIVDRDAVREAAAAVGGSVSIECDFDTLRWVLWPHVGLEELLDAGAFRILSMGIETEPESQDRGTLTWAVTVKLTDVQALRRTAVGAHPGEAESIADSLAVAWQCAADPFAPLRQVPGISWEPGPVEVRHLPRRQR